VAIVGAPAPAAEPPLQPGDRLRIAVAGLPELSAEVLVDADGLVRIPMIGDVPAQGRSVDDVRADARALAEGKVQKRYSADGAALFIAISGEDVAVSVLTRRPVYVTGDVASPGAVPYSPGLTVRAAVAVAGGRSAGGLAYVTPREEMRLKGEYESLLLRSAHARAEMWRLEAELAEDAERPPPAPASMPVSQALYDEIVGDNRERLKTALATLDGQRQFLRDGQAQAAARLELLGGQIVNQRTAVEYDDEELARVSKLFERGIVPIDRLLDMRRAQLASSTRLLQTEDTVERVTLEEARFSRDIVESEERRKIALLGEIEDVRRGLGEIGVRLASTRQQLASIGADLPSLAGAEAQIDVTLHRDEGSGVVSRSATLDERVAPGDVVEVRVDDLQLILELSQ
jgi:polysaccharide export outer membrane protein